MDEQLFRDHENLGADIALYRRQVEASGIEGPAYDRLLGYGTRANAAYRASNWTVVRSELKAGRAEIQSLQADLAVPISVADEALGFTGAGGQSIVPWHQLPSSHITPVPPTDVPLTGIVIPKQPLPPTHQSSSSAESWVGGASILILLLVIAAWGVMILIIGFGGSPPVP